MVIDNIVYSTKDTTDENGKNFLCKIYAKKSLLNLKNGLKLFFNNPSKIGELEKEFDTDETADNLALEIETYNCAKNCTYLKNNEYKEAVGEVNDYKNNFFLSHLFTSGLEDITKTKFNITLEDFNKAVNQVLKDFRQKTVSKGA